MKRGITLELCAGIVDKEGKSLAEIATEEGRTLIRFYDFDSRQNTAPILERFGAHLISREVKRTTISSLYNTTFPPEKADEKLNSSEL